MQSPTGKVTAISGGQATITVTQQNRCARCVAGKGCGAGLLNGSPRTLTLQVASNATGGPLVIGDTVALTLAPENLRRAAMLAYGTPLAGLLAGILFASVAWAPPAEAAAIGCGLAGLLGGIGIGKWRLRRQSCLQHFLPAVIALGSEGSR